MKTRNGFVSNSSSASFIVHFTSTLEHSKIEDLFRKSNEWLNERWDATEIEEYDWSKVKKGKMPTETVIVPCIPAKENLKKNNDCYAYNISVTMFNDWYDLSCWKLLRALHENKITEAHLVSIIQTEDQLEDMNNKVNFNVHTWEENFDKNDKTARITHDAEYLDYLVSIDIAVSEKEYIQIAKNKLSI